MTRRASTLLLLALFGCDRHEQANQSAALAAKQAQVVERGRSVMPFDLDRTMHHFAKVPAGGVQQVLSTDRDPRQVALIRNHLRLEAVRFQNGDFSDPAMIHGADMPGLKTLSTGARQVRVRYSDVPGGGEISFTTEDPALVDAIHKWFDAQVREHGRHAMAS